MIKRMGIFIYSSIKELTHNLSSTCLLAHSTAVEKGQYREFGDWLFNITVTGFLIWLVMITFVEYRTVWSIPVLGIAEWLVMNFIEEIRKRWTS
jgi:hypothetical protein